MLLQPEAVAQNIQAFVIPVTGGLLKRFGWRMNQAVGQFPRQILHNGLRVAALFQSSKRLRGQFITYLLRLTTVFTNGFTGTLSAQRAINSLVSCATIVSASTAAALRCASCAK